MPIPTSSGVRAHRSKILSKGPARPGCCNGLDLERAPESRPQPIPSGVGGFTTSGNPKDVVVRAIEAAHRPADAVELRQVAALGCNEDGDRARRKIGAMLAFLAGYVIGDRDLGARGVPARHRKQRLELRRRYSTRARGDADVRRVADLGSFDYLAQRLSIPGTLVEMPCPGSRCESGRRRSPAALGQSWCRIRSAESNYSAAGRPFDFCAGADRC